MSKILTRLPTRRYVPGFIEPTSNPDHMRLHILGHPSVEILKAQKRFCSLAVGKPVLLWFKWDVDYKHWIVDVIYRHPEGGQGVTFLYFEDGRGRI